LLGPNGAGKTTTIEVLEGLLPATSGDVQIFGLSWGRHDDAIRRQIGVSLQETRLSDKLTVLETVTLFRSFYPEGIEPEDAIAQIDLTEKADARVGKLSGGQRQRLAVACAIVGNPRLLFLDEPTTGLDPASRRQLWEIIRRFREEGRTILLTTHYMDEAERLCDRVAIIDHGRLIALGTPRELIASLGGEHVIELTASSQNGPCNALEAVQRMPGVSSAREENGAVVLSVSEPHAVLPRLLAELSRLSCELTGLTTRHASLEDVFVKLAGRHLSEEEEVPPS